MSAMEQYGSTAGPPDWYLVVLTFISTKSEKMLLLDLYRLLQGYCVISAISHM